MEKFENYTKYREIMRLEKRPVITEVDIFNDFDGAICVTIHDGMY